MPGRQRDIVEAVGRPEGVDLGQPPARALLGQASSAGTALPRLTVDRILDMSGHARGEWPRCRAVISVRRCSTRSAPLRDAAARSRAADAAAAVSRRRIPQAREPPADRLVQDPRRVQRARAADATRSGRAGVVAHSSGNHAQAVARAARLLGIRAVVVMPDNAPDVKVAGVRADGAEIVFVGPHNEERVARAHEIAERRRPGPGPVGQRRARSSPARARSAWRSSSSWRSSAGRCTGRRRGAGRPGWAGGGHQRGLAEVRPRRTGLRRRTVARRRHARLARGRRAYRVAGRANRREPLPTACAARCPPNSRSRSCGATWRASSRSRSRRSSSAMKVAAREARLVLEPSGAVPLAALLFHRRELPAKGRSSSSRAAATSTPRATWSGCRRPTDADLSGLWRPSIIERMQVKDPHLHSARGGAHRRPRQRARREAGRAVRPRPECGRSLGGVVYLFDPVGRVLVPAAQAGLSPERSPPTARISVDDPDELVAYVARERRPHDGRGGSSARHRRPDGRRRAAGRSAADRGRRGRRRGRGGRTARIFHRRSARRRWSREHADGAGRPVRGRHPPGTARERAAWRGPTGSAGWPTPTR